MIRLLHVVTLELKEFYDPKLYPAYAILSHRWKRRKEGGKLIDLEVSCEQLRDGSGCAEGLEKIRRACEAIREFPVEWIWIDSCCIDKNDAVEHTEAINSMYQWYAESYVCIAYLDDVDAFEDVRNSDWFRRGWTLQELIAPERLLFYNTYWQGCGSRNYYDPGLEQHTFQDKSFAISEITRIDVELLRLQDRKKIKRKLDSIPACQKMSWASNRTTTKEEDIAYCLIGIFNIPHMYLKRGEGKRAFIRLQEEIIKQSNDLTLFAWKTPENFWDPRDNCIDDNYLDPPETTVLFFQESPRTLLHGAFACGPSHFRAAFGIEPANPVVFNDEVTVTSRGVKFSNTPLLGLGPFKPFIMPLYCRDTTLPGTPQLLGIELRLLGGSIYARSNCTQLHEIAPDAKIIPNQDDVLLAHYVHQFHDCVGQLHKHAIRLPNTILGKLKCHNVSPGYLWSENHNLLITNGRRFFVGFANYKSHDGKSRGVALLFGLDHLQKPWFCLSNVDPSFEPQILESRRLYLARVWRQASQHERTAYLRNPKPFIINTREGKSEGVLSIDLRQYHDHDVFAVEFAPKASQHSAWEDMAATNTTLLGHYSEGTTGPIPPSGPPSINLTRASTTIPPPLQNVHPSPYSHSRTTSRSDQRSGGYPSSPSCGPDSTANNNTVEISMTNPNMTIRLTGSRGDATPGPPKPSVQPLAAPVDYRSVGMTYESDPKDHLTAPPSPRTDESVFTEPAYHAPVFTSGHGGFGARPNLPSSSSVGATQLRPSSNAMVTQPVGVSFATSQHPVFLSGNPPLASQVSGIPYGLPRTFGQAGTASAGSMASVGLTMQNGPVFAQPFNGYQPIVPYGFVGAPNVWGNPLYGATPSGAFAPQGPGLPQSINPFSQPDSGMQTNAQNAYASTGLQQHIFPSQPSMAGLSQGTHVSMQQSQSAPGQGFTNFTAPMMQALPYSDVTPGYPNR